jgi:outer membrane protein TolC
VLRLDLARARHVDVSAKAKVGIVGPASIASAESELRGMEAAAARAKLNVDEIRATSLPPRDELNAPLAGSRDFVMERLQLDLFVAQQRLTAAEQARAEIERQVRVGAAGELAPLEAGLEVARARAALGTLAERRTLRKQFVEQGTPGEQLMRRFQQVRLRHEAFVAQEALKVSTRRLEAVRKQHALGAAAELDVLRAEVELKEREAELHLLARQLREIGSKGTP